MQVPLTVRRTTARLTALGLAVTCAVGLTVGAASPPARADLDNDKAAIDKQIEQLRDQLHDTNSDLSEAYLALKTSELRMPGVQQSLDRSEAAVARADEVNDAMAAKLAVAQANEARAVAQLDEADQEAKDAQRRLAGFAAQMYQDQGMGQLSVALDATSPDDFATRLSMADTVMDVQSGAIDRLATIRAAANATQSKLEALRGEVAEAKAQSQAALDRADAARAEAQQARDELAGLVAAQEKAAAEVKGKADAERARLSTATAEQAALSRQLAARAAAAKARAAAAAKAAAEAARKRGQSAPAPAPSQGGGSSRSGGYLSAPSNGWISSEFGSRYHPILHYWRLHAGRDYAANCGTAIRAAADGNVISAGWGGGYGNRIMVDHGILRGTNLVTTYNHMSRYAVRGGHVSRGQIIGYVGTTGSSTGCHLHFETYEDGVPKDPRRWL